MSGYKGMYCHKYTEEQKQFILQNYKGITTNELAIRFNQQFGTNIGVAALGSWKKRHNLMNGLDMRFHKGHETHNKGKKWDDFMPKESQESSRKTCFKKGSIPPNLRQVNDERITVDGYVEVKVSMKGKRWVLRSRKVYEEHFGTIPKNHVVLHKNGISTDDRIENLIVISRSELVRLNQDGLMGTDLDVNEAAINIAKVKSKIGERVK